MSNELQQQYRSTAGFWDEMQGDTGVRAHYRQVCEHLSRLPATALDQKGLLAGKLFMNQGVTFTVYSNEEGIERIFPFDLIPRVITTTEWEHIEAGIRQRLRALNLFLKDIYHEQQIIADGIMPASLIASCPHFVREVFGVRVPHDIYVHISGT